jgi:hypothetical protein
VHFNYGNAEKPFKINGMTGPEIRARQGR